MALLAYFDPHRRDGVDLEKAVEMGLVAPGSAVVAVAERPVVVSTTTG
jgi:hypothetical protein